ncbi:hypothetical protein DOTSEDRAFT_138309 [Dothistroma septosporum NZE10]|uniref:Uncharacterized protein n=1 Tax=Dothistroma septosporum (strain NZE10 / CBS 128990) TaxID=675120 RepID=N1PD45_DOTSN|nr:hypothetical protein DOTSEDRAFT_138309 [Dothistroma septosporum NZE10]
MEPPKKKQRLTSEQKPAMLVREMQDPETSLEVDHMILDYLLYHAINTCLSSRGHQTSHDQIERLLLQADEFLALFKSRYGNYDFDSEMRFRQQLLQLVTLFTQRFTQNSTTPSRQSLGTLRERHKARARQWIGKASRVPSANLDTQAYDVEFPLPVEDLERNRARVLEELDIPAEDDLYDDAFYGTRACVSLLDLLPIFMGVSAQCNAMYNSNMKQNLMQLAAAWMLQACLEQYLVFGASGTDTIDEAFAWGYKKNESNDHSSPQRHQSESRVASEAGAEVDGWQEIRDATIEELNAFASSPASYYARQAGPHSYARAEEAFLDYFKALAQGISPPVLVQLEKGILDGMTQEETQDFINGCGLGFMDLLA